MKEDHLTPDEIREKKSDRARWDEEDMRDGIEQLAQQAIHDVDALNFWVRQNDRQTYLDEIDNIRNHGRIVPDVPWIGRDGEPVTELEQRLALGRVAPFGKEE